MKRKPGEIPGFFVAGAFVLDSAPHGTLATSWADNILLVPITVILGTNKGAEIWVL
jgi:hypothetical protein